MKKLLLFSILSLMFLAAKAGDGDKRPRRKPDNDSLYIFNRHKKIFYLGYGIGVISNNYISQNGFQAQSSAQAGPVYFKFERALNPRIGIGLNTYFLYDTWSSSLENDVPRIPVTYVRTYKRTSYGALARFNYHISVNRHLDAYIGGGVGYQAVSWQRTANTTNPPYNYTDTPPSTSPLALEATFGLRYLLGPHWLIYAEGGYCKSVLQAGISFNIPKP